jgi:hypothetical protein
MKLRAHSAFALVVVVLALTSDLVIAQSNDDSLLQKGCKKILNYEALSKRADSCEAALASDKSSLASLNQQVSQVSQQKIALTEANKALEVQLAAAQSSVQELSSRSLPSIVQSINFHQYEQSACVSASAKSINALGIFGSAARESSNAVWAESSNCAVLVFCGTGEGKRFAVVTAACRMDGDKVRDQIMEKLKNILS